MGCAALIELLQVAVVGRDVDVTDLLIAGTGSLAGPGRQSFFARKAGSDRTAVQGARHRLA